MTNGLTLNYNSPYKISALIKNENGSEQQILEQTQGSYLIGKSQLSNAALIDLNIN